jgi:PHP family Zn ribbon phosphoesterase
VKADLHVHTVLSPCGDLDMSPRAIISAARRRGLDMIGITDHNSTRQAPVVQEIGRREGILVLAGAEVTTREEIHCLAFLPSRDTLDAFQRFLDEHLPDVPNDPARFGYQVVVDADEQILHEEPRLLLSALDSGIEEIETLVHALGGIFIPAHVDKPRDSLLSQLGFLPPGLACDAIELSRHADPARVLAGHPFLHACPVTRSSDAHYLPDIGAVYTELAPRGAPTFPALREALRALLPPVA